MAMKEINLNKVFKFFDNGGIFLAGAASGEDQDIMPVGWTCPIQLDSVITMVSPGHYTRKLIDASNMFVLMVPTVSIVEVAAKLGTTTKHKNPNKLKESGAKLLSANKYGLPIIEGCSAFAIFQRLPCSLKGPICGKAIYAEAEEGLFESDHWIMKDIPFNQRSLRYAPGGQWYVDGDPVLIDLDWEPPK